MSQPLRHQLYTIIFGTDTSAGKRFDVVLLYAIVLSVAALMLDTVVVIQERWPGLLYRVEWFFTILFTIEYATRIYCSPNRRKYVLSFYGVVDLVSIVPTYLALLITGANYLLIIRLIRVFRVFRVFKMFRYLSEANLLVRSLWLGRRKILVFFLGVLVLSTVFGSLMYLVEGPEYGFTSIPKSIYWTIVTITTVGYGDITPHTVLGQVVSTLAMLTGYSIIAIPTGIVTAEMAAELQREKTLKKCTNCGKRGHDSDADYCKWCGAEMV